MRSMDFILRGEVASERIFKETTTMLRLLFPPTTTSPLFPQHHSSQLPILSLSGRGESHFSTPLSKQSYCCLRRLPCLPCVLEMSSSTASSTCSVSPRDL